MRTQTKHSIGSPLVEAVCVDPIHVKAIWPSAKGFIESAILKTGLSDFAEVEKSILSGMSLLWLAWDGKIKAAAATTLEKANGKLSCVIVACGGHEMPEWLTLIEPIEQYAKNEGCQSMRVIGRKGWCRVLEDYQMKYVILEKAL
jgi:hypothetical protein